MTRLELAALNALKRDGLYPWDGRAVETILYAVPQIANKAHAVAILMNLADDWKQKC